MVQEPNSAAVPLMVQSALKRGGVDFVLTLDQITQTLCALGMRETR
jgi:chemotaxis response regulator CheB